MSGHGETLGVVTRGEQRKKLLRERDERIVSFMNLRRPVAAIAELEGLPEDYCRKAVNKLAVEHGIDYQPISDTSSVGLTESSRTFRNNMANVLARHREQPGRHQLEVARDTGLTQTQQIAATQRPNDHNWTLAQLERTARMTGKEFTPMMLRALLTPEQYEKVRRCLNI